MLKLNASYAKKIPASQQFSSESCHCSMEIELSDNLSPREIQKKIHETYGQLREAVEAELAGGHHKTNGGALRKGSNGQATTAQVEFIRVLAARNRISTKQLAARIKSTYGVESPYELSKKAASALVEELKGPQAQTEMQGTR